MPKEPFSQKSLKGPLNDEFGMLEVVSSCK